MLKIIYLYMLCTVLKVEYVKLETERLKLPQVATVQIHNIGERCLCARPLIPRCEALEGCQVQATERP